MNREKDFAKALTQCRATCAELFNLIKDEEKAKVRRWEDEKPSLELLVTSLNQTCDIIKKEKKRLATELAAKQASVPTNSSQGPKHGHKHPHSDHSSHHPGKDPAILQRELDELNSRVLATDIELQNANQELATCERADERDYLSTKCVVLQDIRRILMDEMQALRSDLARIDASSRLEAERRRAEESGWAEVARLEDQLERTTARLDRVKQQLYFPAAKGYRFSSGNGGIYVAARDLHVSEVSGRFEFICEPIKRRAAVTAATSSGGAASTTAATAHGNRVARLTVALGGVSASTALAEWSEARRGGAQAATGGSGGLGGGGGGADGPFRSGAGGKLSHSSSSLSNHSSQGPGAVAEGDTTSGGGGLDPTALARQRAGGHHPPQQSQPSTPRSGGMSGGSTPRASPAAAAAAPPTTTATTTTTAAATGRDVGGSPRTLPPPHPHPHPHPQPHPHPGPHPASTPSALPPGLPPHLQQQYLRQQQQFQQQQQQQRQPLQGFSSVPLPTGAPPAAATALHRRGPSHDGAAAGSTSAVLPPPRAKGEAVANFLSGLKNKKEKLKSMVGGLVGEKDDHGGHGAEPAGGGHGLESMGAGAGASGPGRLRAQMMEKLHDGLSESKGKITRLSKAIATKAPEALRDIKSKIRPAGRAGSGGGAQELVEWETDSVRSAATTHNSQQLDGSLLDSTLLQLADTDYFRAGGGGGDGEAAASAALEAAGPPGGAGAGAGPASLASGGGVTTGSAPQPAVANRGSGLVADGDVAPGSAAAATAAAATGAGEGPAADNAADDSDQLSGFVEDFECRPSRKGVYVQLLGERVELLGERGTKVPDTSIREIMLEVEVAVTAVFEYHSTGGTSANGGGAWLAPEPVSFNILQLDHRMRGNTLPLPRTLLKGLLNAYMPGLLTGLLAGLLPAELGAYTAASGETQALSGEFKVAGPSLSTTVTSIAPAPRPPSDPTRRAQWTAAHAAAGRARAMLGLSEAQAAAVSELFGGCGRPSLIPDSAGVAPSIAGLCRFYVSYSGSELWNPLMGVLNRALQSAFDFHGVKAAERFSLSSFLEGPVARLVRKPLRIAFTIERLSLALDCDAALHTLRDFFERMAREFEAKGASRTGGGGAGSETSGPPREPLDVQLELLDLWHASLAKMLRAFKQRFRCAGATLLASADRRIFQFGAESVMYDGPLKLKLPLDLAMDPDGSFLIDVKLPDREEATKSITSLLTEVMYSLSTTHNSAAAAAAAAAAAGGAAAPGSAHPATAATSNSTHGAAVAAGAATAAHHNGPRNSGGNTSSNCNTMPTTNTNPGTTASGGGGSRGSSHGGLATGSGGGDTGGAFATFQQLHGAGGTGAGPLTEPPSHESTAQAVRARAAAVQGMLGSGGGAPAAGSSSSGGGGGSPTAVGHSPASAPGSQPHSQQSLPPVATAATAAALGPVQSGSALFEIGHEWAAALAEGMPEGGAVAAGTAPLLQHPVVGQLCVKKLALSLKLDEQRVMELLSGPGGASALAAAAAAPASGSSSSSGGGSCTAAADIAGRLLGCYGDLFTASLDLGWRPESDVDGAVQRPCCMLTVQSNDITRLRADMEGLWFQSTVSPRLAVRVLQAVVIALVLKFHAADSYSIHFWNRAFNQLHEYLSRGSLDLAVCLSARATMDRTQDRLRVELSGQDLNAPPTHAQAQAGSAAGAGGGGNGNGGGGGGGGQGLLGRVCPVYLLNDVNLMTVLDSVKLLSEAGPPPPPPSSSSSSSSSLL